MCVHILLKVSLEMFDFGGGKAANLILNGALSEGKCASSWLFCGDELDDVTEVAKKFAMAINCVNKIKPCYSCEHCEEFLFGSYVDYEQLNTNEQINKNSFTVEQARSLISRAHSKPIKGLKLIFLICGVDSLHLSCSNVFLKILEELPRNVVFILTAKNNFSVLPTILSRCKIVNVTGLGKKKCLEILIKQFNHLSKKQIDEAVHFGGGFLFKSRKFLENALFQQGLQIANAMLSAYLQKDELQFVCLVAKIGADISLIEVVFGCFCTLLHDRLLNKINFVDDLAEIKRVFECFEWARSAILRNCNLKFVLIKLSCDIFVN